jgi:hypothetical protein
LSIQGSPNGGKGGPTQRIAKNGKPYGTCWNCGGVGHVSKQCPSLQSSASGSTSRLDKGKGRAKEHNPCSPASSKGSVNATVPSEEDGVWSAFKLADLYDDNVSISDSGDSVQSLFDVSWDHIPGYLSDTSSSEAHGSMPSLLIHSDSSDTTSMPSLKAVSSLSGSSAASDWLSEVGDAAPGDDPVPQSDLADFTSAIADLDPEENNDVAPSSLRSYSILAVSTYMIRVLLSTYPRIAISSALTKRSHQSLSQLQISRSFTLSVLGKWLLTYPMVLIFRSLGLPKCFTRQKLAIP